MTSPKLKASAAALSRRTRVVNALRVALKRVEREASDADEDLVNAVDDADILLRHFDQVIAEGRSAARESVADRIRHAPERARLAREEEFQKAAILGQVPELGPAKPEAKVEWKDQKVAAEKDAEKFRTSEPQAPTPRVLDPDTQRAVNRTRELNKANRAAKKSPTAPATGTEE